MTATTTAPATAIESPQQVHPGWGLRTVNRIMNGYSSVFASGPIAPLLSRPKPVRHSGFDLDLRVSAVVHEADDVVSLLLQRPDGSDLPRWTPGAHVDIFLPSGRQRQYSLNGDPADRTHYRIAVRKIADGKGGSLEIHETFTAGTSVHVRGPRNAFPLIDTDSHLFVAGGIGITPILPMVRRRAALGGAWRLVYLGRSRASMPFLTELRELATRSGGVLDIRPDDEFGIPDVAEILRSGTPGDAVYMCGPTPLMDAAKIALPHVNPTASLHTERFSPRPVLGGEPFTVTLARTGTTIDVAGDETALEAVRRAKPDVSYSCQQGFCGSCKVKVLAGAIDHRDTRLFDNERADSMLICVSRADGDLVLDI